MRFFIFTLLIFSLISCSEPKKLSVYTVYINYDEINSTGSRYSIETKIDTIHSLNDSTAYVKAIFMAEARQRANNAYSKTRLGEAKVYYFFAEDSLGNNLGDKLGVLKIDEINSRLLIISDESKGKYLY